MHLHSFFYHHFQFIVFNIQKPWQPKFAYVRHAYHFSSRSLPNDVDIFLLIGQFLQVIFKREL